MFHIHWKIDGFLYSTWFNFVANIQINSQNLSINLIMGNRKRKLQSQWFPILQAKIRYKTSRSISSTFWTNERMIKRAREKKRTSERANEREKKHIKITKMIAFIRQLREREKATRIKPIFKKRQANKQSQNGIKWNGINWK